MLHISDIEERLKRNPEPKEVADMRRRINDAFKNLEFIEEGHKYYIHNDDGTVDCPISVSGIIQEYEQKVDWEQKMANVANREGVGVEVIKRRWEENNVKATNSGSLNHLYGEMLMKMCMGQTDFSPVIAPQFEKGYLIPSNPKQEAINKYWADLLEIDDMYPLIPEAKMYMPKDNTLGIKRLFCGTADITLAIKYKGEWCIVVHDFKTNASLTNEYVRKTDTRMLAPFDEYYDDALGHYTFQLSAYSLMLMNIGFKVVDRKLIWLKENGEYEKVKVDDITDKIKEELS